MGTGSGQVRKKRGDPWNAAGACPQFSTNPQFHRSPGCPCYLDSSRYMMRYLRILTGFPVWSLAVELEELKQAVGRTDPAAVLVSPRVLRRILQEAYQVPFLLVQAPHERCYFFDREVLFRHVEQDELEIEPDRLLPPTVILLARPTAERLESATADELLSRYWRLLFHCHVHMALEKRHRQGHLTLDTVRARIDQIGRTEFEEIRSVLHEEKDLLPPGDDLRTYIEFAAVYLELRYFRAN